MSSQRKTAIVTGASQGIGADAVMYLTDAATVTGNILYVDGGAHFGRW